MTSPDAATDTALSGADLRHALQVAELWLEANREALNAINVYPVPDGDTGTNMLLTLRAANAALTESGGAGAISKALADAALLGARGNSGVILSQMLRGFADALEGVETLGAAELRAALSGASETAYDAVPEPVEGTMLTVMREAAAVAAEADAALALDALLAVAVEEAEASVERTPDLLPRLREAGVVDAGGQGVAVVLAGLLYGVRREPLPEPPPAPTGEVDLSGVEHEGHGYCVEYIVQGQGLERAVLAAQLAEAEGESVLVVGDPSALRVHVHMEDPGVALSAGAAHGGLQSVKVDNMQAQHESWAAAHEDAEDDDAPPPPIGLVAVVQGPGLTAVFRELGVTRIVSGGATNNPSAGELLEAARRAGRERVFILPNDSNVLLAAEQAAQQEPDLIRVVPARTVAAGLAAALSFVPSEPPESLAESLTSAAASVRCVEVTRAVRDAVADGVSVTAGDAIAILDGRLVARADEIGEALLAGIGHALESDDALELATVYLGVDAPAGSAERIPVLLEDAYEELEVEVFTGGQPHYPYLVSLE